MTTALHSVIAGSAEYLGMPRFFKLLKLFLIQIIGVPMLGHSILYFFVCPVNVPRHIVYSEASDVACASCIYVEVEGFLVAHKNFDDLEMKQSFTWRELKFVSFALRRFPPILHNSSVKLYTIIKL